MGVRQYDPTTGRFLSTDPVSGGNENDYNYPNDPNNMSDVNGEYCVYFGSYCMYVYTYTAPVQRRPSPYFGYGSYLYYVDMWLPSYYRRGPTHERRPGYRNYTRKRRRAKGKHDKGKRPSTLGKHQKGNQRRGRDQGGEKGDKRRPYYR